VIAALQKIGVPAISDNVSEIEYDGVIDQAAIVEAGRRIRKLQETIEQTQGKAKPLREKLASAREELGAALLDARRAWPASGPSAAGWGKFLATHSINERTARRYMDLAQGKPTTKAAVDLVAQIQKLVDAVLAKGDAVEIDRLTACLNGAIEAIEEQEAS
jgi:hypothetical protein